MPKKGILDTLKETVSQKTGEQMEKFWNKYLDKHDKMGNDGNFNYSLDKITETSTSDILKRHVISLTTKTDQAYFWSGLGENGAEIALQIANKNNCTTLEKILNDKKIDLPEFDPTDVESVQAWKNVSKIYAEKASGDVRVVLGESINAMSTFITIEYPTLVQNKKVNRIIAVDIKSGYETILIDKHNFWNNKHMKIYFKNGMKLVKFE